MTSVSLHCPVDGTILRALRIGGYGCRQCLGAWFPYQAATRVLGHIAKPDPKSATSNSTRRCPVHDAPLLAAPHRKGPEVNVCQRCGGVWLDAGELQQIMPLQRTANSRIGYGEAAPSSVGAATVADEPGFPPAPVTESPSHRSTQNAEAKGRGLREAFAKPEPPQTPPAWMRAIALAVRCLFGAIAVYVTAVLILAVLGGDLTKGLDLVLRIFVFLVAVIGFVAGLGEDHRKQTKRHDMANERRSKPPPERPRPPRFHNWPGP